jgi:hypothetical protein
MLSSGSLKRVENDAEEAVMIMPFNSTGSSELLGLYLLIDRLEYIPVVHPGPSRPSFQTSCSADFTTPIPSPYHEHCNVSP